MADNFSIGFAGLTGRAQKFIKESIDDGDGVINASERKALADFLNGTKELPAEYSGVRDELEEFARYYDVQAARSELYPEEAEDIEMSCQILGKDANTIDCDKDYLTTKEYADGKRGTPQEQAYARALMERSPYARERMAKEAMAEITKQNRALLAENEDLKSQLAKYEDRAENTKSLAENAIKQLPSLDIQTTVKNRCQASAEKILSCSDEIIATVNNSSSNPKETIERLKKMQNNIISAKAEGRAALEEIVPKQVESESSTERKNISAGAEVARIKILQKLFSND